MSYREDLFRTWVDLERLEQQMRPATHFVPQQFDSTCYVAEKMRRVVCVRKALDDSLTLARSMVAKALMGVEISTVWDILVGVCRDIAFYYGGSVLTGSVIGGVGGAFFGWGVGAVPGTIAGASSGAAIGGWILGLLGLRALVEDLVGTLPRALQYYQQGIQEAWGSSENRSCSGPAEWNHGSLSQASFLLANGHVQMVIALLSALMLWISRGRGERANALQSINQSARLGPGFAKWIEANEEKLHTLLASRSRQGGGGAGRAAESAAAKAAKGKAAKNKPGKEADDGAKVKKSNSGEKGKCGEWLAKMDMIRGGFDEVVSVQNNSGHGVDLIGRNSKTGEVKVWEVKTTDGAKAPGLSREQAKLGGEKFTENRLARARGGVGNYGKVPEAMKNANRARNWIKDAKEEGQRIAYEKREVFVDDLDKGCAKHPDRPPKTIPWLPR